MAPKLDVQPMGKERGDEQLAIATSTASSQPTPNKATNQPPARKAGGFPSAANPAFAAALAAGRAPVPKRARRRALRRQEHPPRRGRWLGRAVRFTARLLGRCGLRRAEAAKGPAGARRLTWMALASRVACSPIAWGRFRLRCLAQGGAWLATDTTRFCTGDGMSDACFSETERGAGLAGS